MSGLPRFPLSDQQLQHAYKLRTADPSGNLRDLPHMQVSIACRLARTFDGAQLEAAVHHVAAQHAMLRVLFTEDADSYAQYDTGVSQIHVRAAEPAPVDTSSGGGPTDDASGHHRWGRKAPVDYRSGPTSYLTATTEADGTQVVQIVLGHLIADFASAALVLTELERALLDRGHGRPASEDAYLRLSTIQAQQRADRFPRFDEWRERLTQMTTALGRPDEIPDFDRTVLLPFTAEQSEQLAGRAATARVTVPALLLASFHVVVEALGARTPVGYLTVTTGRSGIRHAGVGVYSRESVLRIGRAPGASMPELARSCLAELLYVEAHPMPSISLYPEFAGVPYRNVSFQVIRPAMATRGRPLILRREHPPTLRPGQPDDGSPGTALELIVALGEDRNDPVTLILRSDTGHLPIDPQLLVEAVRDIALGDGSPPAVAVSALRSRFLDRAVTRG